MVAQAASQEVTHSLINEASVTTRKNAIAEAIADVIPDWMIAGRAVSQARTLNDLRLPATPASNLYPLATCSAAPPRFAAFTAP
jgi:hypothetical protein